MSATEPTELRAGDPWAWRRDDLTDYPATEWTLAYWFKNQAGGFQVAAAADGVAFEVDESSDDTENLVAGNYSWQARVTNIADADIRHVVDSGSLKVLQNLFVGVVTDPLDGRTHAQIMVDRIEALLQDKTLDLAEYTIKDRGKKYVGADALEKLRDKYRYEVARAGGNTDIYVRFARA